MTDPKPRRSTCQTAAILALVSLTAPPLAEARQDEPLGAADAEPGPLVVAVREAPPFVIDDGGGHWSGIAVELWEQVAEGLGRESRYRLMDLEDLLVAVEAGEVDAGLGALSITADRERRVDFSHPFYISGLGIAAATGNRGNGWGATLRRLAGGPVAVAVGGVLAVLVVVGALIWLFERRLNDQFAGPSTAGIGQGLWWAAVTMTTVGYGDKAPVTLAGRLLGVLWMFASLFLVAAFTASITAALTVSQFDAPIRGVADLFDHRVGAVAGSTGSSYLEGLGVPHREFSSAGDGLTAMAEGRLDAFVQDRPILRYLVNNNRALASRIVILPESYEPQRYGIALAPESHLREPVNRELLSAIEGNRWESLIERYLD